jgi:hypothetical protein
MVKTYKIAKSTPAGFKAFPYGPFTLAQAESLRDDMLKAGFSVYVINIHAE